MLLRPTVYLDSITGVTDPSVSVLTGAGDDFAAHLAEHARAYPERRREWLDRLDKLKAAGDWRAYAAEVASGPATRPPPGSVKLWPYTEERWRQAQEATAKLVAHWTPIANPYVCEDRWRPAYVYDEPSRPAYPRRDSSGTHPLAIPVVLLAIALSVAEGGWSNHADLVAGNYVTNLGLAASVVALLQGHRRQEARR